MSAPLLLVLLAGGCGDPAPGPGAPADAPGASAGSTPAPGGEIPGGAPAAAEPPEAALCRHPCAILTMYEISHMHAYGCDVCGKYEPSYCQKPWPWEGTPPCARWEWMEKCIFASYGYPFKDGPWRTEFEAQPWYKRDETYTQERVSPISRLNIAAIAGARAQGWLCQP